MLDCVRYLLKQWTFTQVPIEWYFRGSHLKKLGSFMCFQTLKFCFESGFNTTHTFNSLSGYNFEPKGVMHGFDVALATEASLTKREKK